MSQTMTIGTGAARRRSHVFAASAGLALALALAACTGGPSATPGGAASIPAGSAGAGAPLVGGWVTSVTKDDFEAAGLTDPGLQNENSGKFTWTFAADGTWTLIQESLDGSPINSPVFRGTYTVDGESLVAITEFPAEYADSGLHYTFTLDGASVQFDLLDPPDAILPVIVETHPWTRAS